MSGVRYRLHPLWAICISLLITNSIAQATQSDMAKEARWADQVIDGLLDGEEVWLDDGSGHEFLGIITETEETTGRAAIIVHGIGVHPDWPDVVHPLRVGLIEHGWSTLSIQMPILPNEAEGSDYVPLFPEISGRFNTAMAYLAEQGLGEVVIVAHSMGSTMAARYLAHNKSPALAFVAVGTNAGISSSDIDNISAFGKITIPVLDLYGAEDLESVIASAGARAGALNNLQSRQIKVEGAGHFFQGMEGQLVDLVQMWINDIVD